MSPTDDSFDTLRNAIQSIWSAVDGNNMAITGRPEMLVLILPSDIAAFSVVNSQPEELFQRTYEDFKQLYRQNSREWDQRTLSFVLCRSFEEEKDDRFYAALEQDPLFCRKYVIRSLPDLDRQCDELLRLPFFPLRGSNGNALQRPQSAQDLLKAAGLPATLARNLVEAGVRSPEGIAMDLREGKYQLPTAIATPRPGHLTLSRPHAHSRLVSLTVDGFRAYRDKQTFLLDAPVVVLYGPNGLGKTSIFDAIDYACTGRIGRLNQKRSSTEFARIATHLDKTPGSGSVKVEVCGKEGNDSVIWKLERSTGDWSNAWINGDKADRKAVIGKLTQANWLESAPRQKAYENLFRATHLFGQDELEMLATFKKDSVIPAAFISDMLALQDYSQGISKAVDVASQLMSYRVKIEEDLGKRRLEAKALDDSILELGDSDPETESTPVENILQDIRGDLDKLELYDNLPPISPTVSTFSEWQEVLSGEGDATESLISEVRKLETELPTYKRLQEESGHVRERLKQIEGDLTSITTTEQESIAALEANVAMVSNAEELLRQHESRRQELRAAVEALGQIEDLKREITTLSAERDRQMLERSESDARLTTIEAAMSKVKSNVSESEHVASELNDEIGKIKGLLEDFSKYESDEEALSGVHRRLEEAKQLLQEASVRKSRAEVELRTATSAREAAAPDYERALARQAEIDKLLDSIQAHVHDRDCPLCGSAFESVEELLAEIGRKRRATQSASNVTVSFKILEAEEAKASDALRVIVSEVKTIEYSITELTTLQESIEAHINNFRERLSSVAVGMHEGTTKLSLAEALHDLEIQNVSAAKRLSVANTELLAMVQSKSEESSRRNATSERFISLDRNLQALNDRSRKLEAKISQTDVTNMGTPEEVDEAVAQKDLAIQQALITIEQLRTARELLVGKRSVSVNQKSAAEESLQSAISSLSGIQRSITDYELRLKKFSVAPNASAKEFHAVRGRLERRAEGIRAAVDRAGVVLTALKARDRRLQLAEKRTQAEAVKEEIVSLEVHLRRVKESHSVLTSTERLLKKERQGAIGKHIDTYGPMITRIQQRLRSVYGFGGVNLEAQNGETKVSVEWRKKDVHVQPSDFFSDSQKQILMLSIFLAGGLRQTWSGFAPMLLDDPVTHFDDLNAYGFVEMIRGIVATSPDSWQFVISTCEERLFNLMQKKYTSSNAIFYQFMGLSEGGPIVERR